VFGGLYQKQNYRLERKQGDRKWEMSLS